MRNRGFSRKTSCGGEKRTIFLGAAAGPAPVLSRKDDSTPRSTATFWLRGSGWLRRPPDLLLAPGLVARCEPAIAGLRGVGRAGRQRWREPRQSAVAECRGDGRTTAGGCCYRGIAPRRAGADRPTRHHCRRQAGGWQAAGQSVCGAGRREPGWQSWLAWPQTRPFIPTAGGAGCTWPVCRPGAAGRSRLTRAEMPNALPGEGPGSGSAVA